MNIHQWFIKPVHELGAMTHLGMISYQGPTGACDGRAKVTLGYRPGGQSDSGQTDYIRTK